MMEGVVCAVSDGSGWDDFYNFFNTNSYQVLELTILMCIVFGIAALAEYLLIELGLVQW